MAALASAVSSFVGGGLRCAGGATVHHGVKVASVGGAASWGPGLASTHGWSSGEVRNFQGYYRDTVGSPCGSGFNLTHGLTVICAP